MYFLGKAKCILPRHYRYDLNLNLKGDINKIIVCKKIGKTFLNYIPISWSKFDYGFFLWFLYY